MNPFSIASEFGYDTKQILEFASKAIPGFEDKIKYALASGYTTDQVLKFLQNAFKDGKSLRQYAKKNSDQTFGERINKRGSEFEKQKYSEIKNRRLNEFFDADRLQATAGGAAIGAAIGGPVGAIGGAIGGSKAHDEIMKGYERQLAEGGNLSLKDYLSAIIKGGAKGFAASSAVMAAQDILQNLGGKKGEQPQEPQNMPEQEDVLGGQDRAVSAPQKPQDTGFLQGVDFGSLTPTVKGKLVTLKKQYDKMVSEGVDPSDKRLQKILKRRDEIIRGEGLSFGEKEKDRFEKEYEKPEAEPQAEPQIDEKESLKITRDKNPKGWSFDSVFQPTLTREKDKKVKAQPFQSALKSSNVSAATFDADTGLMRVLFKAKEGRGGGNVYSYENMDLDTFNKMTGGNAKPVTEGSNKFGVWFGTKNPSIGAAFSKFIKSDPEKFPYQKLDEKSYTVEEKKLIEADRAHLASEIFEPFAKERLKGRQQARAKGLKDIEPALRNIDDEFTTEIVQYLEDILKQRLKGEPKVSQLQKEFRKEFFNEGNSRGAKKANRRVPRKNDKRGTG